jgi:ATP/maltotriose-dependent transcriptional regulator MalT
MATALFHLAMVAAYKGDLTAARSRYEESIVLSREVGNTSGIAGSLFWSAFMLFSQGDLAQAQAVAEESLMLYRDIGIKSGEAYVVPVLGEIAFYQDDTTSARLLFEQACAFYQKVANEVQIAWTLSLLGKVVAAQGDLRKARALYEESLIRGKGVNSHLGFLDLPPALEGLAAVVAAQGEPAWAARLWGTAEAQREAYSTPLAPVYCADYERAVAAARTQLGEQNFAAAWAEGRSMSWEQTLAARGPVTIPVQPQSTGPMKSLSTYPDGLTAREVEVLRLVAQGLSNAEVAERLIISLLTVKAHMRSLYNKLGISSRSAATRYAIEHHLL